jgi:hypothetical protein
MLSQGIEGLFGAAFQAGHLAMSYSSFRWVDADIEDGD